MNSLLSVLLSHNHSFLSLASSFPLLAVFQYRVELGGLVGLVC
jgi:hypothetical protein